MHKRNRVTTMRILALVFLGAFILARFVFNVTAITTFPAIILEALLIVVCCVLVWFAT